jgi:hypothetical protein
MGMIINPLFDTVSATIANGASLSGAVALSGRAAIRILMPGSWTTANLTFQVSMDDATYYNLYDSAGNEVTVAAAAAIAIVLDPATFCGCAYLKIRSGTSGTPINQAADRALSVVAKAFQ